jgi:transposase
MIVAFIRLSEQPAEAHDLGGRRPDRKPHGRLTSNRTARKGVESSQRLGRRRWVVESCLSWFTDNRRLARRYERKAEHFQAFADRAAILICHRRLTKITK